MNAYTKLCRVFVILALVSVMAGVVQARVNVPQEAVPGGVVNVVMVKSPQTLQFLSLHNFTTLYRDGRGDLSIQQTIQNTGYSDVTELSWTFTWPSEDYSNIYATDSLGPLQVATYRDASSIVATVLFRHPVIPGSAYWFAVNITIADMAVVSGNTGEASWYISFGGTSDFVEGVTFPSNTTFNSISPAPSIQRADYLEWDYMPTQGYLLIDVLYTLSATTDVQPFLEFPINYDGYSFDQAASGIGSANRGLVTAWLDHSYPTYETASNEITPWTGTSLPDLPNVPCTYGVNCYSGHNGIDLQHDYLQPQQSVYAAAAGTVVEACRNNPCSRGAGYGKYILINHNNGYATFYAHLASINSDIYQGTVVSEHYPIAIMGNSGSPDVHLHFGLYYDANASPTWLAGTEVDPYGWKGNNTDPATVSPHNFPVSKYLWKHPLSGQLQLDSSGGSITTPSKTIAANVPAGALSSLLTLDLFNAPEAAPSAQLKSLGYSFQLRVLEWLSGNQPQSVETQSFAVPVTVSVSYLSEDVVHINESTLKISRWDGSLWVVLPTTVDSFNKITYATTTQPGAFDLQGSLSCSTDSGEVDDRTSNAKDLSSGTTSKSFDSLSDQDWFVLYTKPGLYQVFTSQLSGGVDTVMYLYDKFGAFLAYDDDSGGNLSSYLSLYFADAGPYYLQVVPYSYSTVGCSATYRVSVQAPKYVYLPIVRR